MPEGLAVRAAATAQVFVDDMSAPQLRDDDAHHLARVLRLRPGEPVVAADGQGSWVECRYRGAGGGDPLEVTGAVRFEPRSVPTVVMAFAPVKGDRPEWVVQKLTELGVDVVTVFEAERSVVRWREERAERALDRLGRVAREAAAQCRRVWLPEVTAAPSLAELAASGESLAMAEPGGAPPSLALPSVAIGPEGGWSDAERALGLPRVGLGPTILRAETAAVAAGAILASLRAGLVASTGAHGDTAPLGARQATAPPGALRASAPASAVGNVPTVPSEVGDST